MSDTGKALATLDESNWDLMVRQAKTLVESGFLPSHIKTPAQAITIMLTGAELGVPKMQALRQIYVVGASPPACRSSWPR